MLKFCDAIGRIANFQLLHVEVLQVTTKKINQKQLQKIKEPNQRA